MTTFDFKKADMGGLVCILPTILVETSKSTRKCTKTKTLYFGFWRWAISLDIIRPLASKTTEA